MSYEEPGGERRAEGRGPEQTVRMIVVRLLLLGSVAIVVFASYLLWPAWKRHHAVQSLRRALHDEYLESIGEIEKPARSVDEAIRLVSEARADEDAALALFDIIAI